MRRERLLVLMLVCHMGGAAAQEVSPWVAVEMGTLPIILAAPHGGREKPLGLVARRYGQLVTDENTQELALKLAAEMETTLGGRAHLVLCRMHRSRVDCNRDRREGAQGNEEAEAVWRAYHEAIDVARARVTAEHGYGLVLDLHGHRHPEPNVELGYLVTAAELRRSDAALAADGAVLRASSIRDWVGRSGLSLAEVLRGATSLGSLLERNGVRALPSDVRPQPGRGQPYFSGAYDIERHGSREGGPVSAIQVECPWEGVRDTEENQRRFAVRFTRALAEYLELHTGWRRGRGGRENGAMRGR